MAASSVLEKEHVHVDKHQHIGCTHCGEPCYEEVFTDQGTFCCNGCAAVYDLINSHDLCDYYALSEVKNRPSLQQSKQKGDFSYLDLPAVQQQLKVINQGEWSNIVLHCPAMSCASCVYLLDNLHKFNPAIKKSQASFSTRSVSIWFAANAIKISELANLTTSLGYEPAFSIDNDASRNQINRTASNKLLARLGLAGFVAGNTMMLSFPEYVGLEKEVYTQFAYIFTGLNVALATLTILYAARPWFTKSGVDLRHGQLSVDVPIAMAIGVLYMRSMIDIATGNGPGFFDSMSGLIFLLLIGQWLQTRYYEGLEFERQFSSFFPLVAQVLTNSGQLKSTLINQLEPGMTMSLGPNELIPADGVVKTSNQALTDWSFITGESAEKPTESGQHLYAGVRLTTGQLTMVVTQAADQSYLNRLWNEAAGNDKFQYMPTRFENLFVKYFTAITLVIAFSTLAFWLMADSSMAFNAFTSVLMVACPCALTLAMPFAFNKAVTRLAKNGAYARNAQVIERLAHIDHIAFDKTGTLTQPVAPDPNQGFWHPAPGQGVLVNEIAPIAYAASKLSGHPLLHEIGRKLSKYDPAILKYYVEQTGHGVKFGYDDAIYRIGAAKYCYAPNDFVANSTAVHVSKDGQWLGYFRMGHELSPAVAGMLKQLPLNKTVITGDNINGAAVIQGLVDVPLNLLTNQKPEDKMAFIQQATDANEQVLMVGDGMNDGPAMKAATVSMALVDNRNSFSPNADILAQRELLPRLPQWLAFSQATLSMVKVGLALSVVYNIIGLTWAITGQLSPLLAAIFMPLSSMSVVALSVLLTDWQANKILKD